jgi:hypothetical protein
MKSRLPATIQQKYWDQGRSTALFMTSCPIFRARSSCGTGGKPTSASIFLSARSWIDSAGGCRTQLMSVWGLRPTYYAMLATKR